jgi:hypothetical protein
MLNKYKVNIVGLSGKAETVYNGTDSNTALTVYVMSVNKVSKSCFIELYKNNQYHRSTIGRM